MSRGNYVAVLMLPHCAVTQRPFRKWIKCRGEGTLPFMSVHRCSLSTDKIRKKCWNCSENDLVYRIHNNTSMRHNHFFSLSLGNEIFFDEHTFIVQWGSPLLWLFDPDIANLQRYVSNFVIRDLILLFTSWYFWPEGCFLPAATSALRKFLWKAFIAAFSKSAIIVTALHDKPGDISFTTSYI